MPTKSDLLKEKLDLIFANRQKQTELFTKLITSEKLESSLLIVRGLGGIGKTMLLGAYQRICAEKSVPVAIIDVGVQRNVAEALRSMRDQLAKNEQGFSATNFDAAVERYLKLDSELKKLGSISIRALEFISKATVLSPSALSPKVTEKIDLEGEDYGLVINRIYQKLEKGDADYFVNPEEYLSKELLKDINDYTQNHHLCVMFDRYEVVPVYLDRWIRQDFFANLAELVLVVISGRSLLPPEWGKWRPLMKNIELSPFPKSEIQELLQLFGITSSYLIEQIAQFSGGVPLAVSLAAQLVKDRNTEDFSMVTEKYNVIEQLVEVLVRDASPELEKILEVCAALRWFNEEAVYALSDEPIKAEVYRKVRNYEFIRQGRYGFEMHDRVRDFINQDLVRRVPIRYKKLNQLASDYYSKLMLEDAVHDRRLLILEKLYHKLRADEKEGMSEMRQVFNDAALLIQPSFCQSLIEVAESSTLSDEINSLWVEYFKGSLARQSSDFLQAENIFRALAQNPIVERDNELTAELYYYWGVSLWYICKFEEALEISRKAMKLNQKLGKVRFENRALGAIGLAHDRMGNFKEALDTVTQLVSQARKTDDRISEAYGLNSTGYFSWHLGKWDKSEDVLLQQRQIWVELGSKFGECYPHGHLGRLYADIYDFPKASEHLNLGLALSTETGNKEMQAVILINLTAFEMYQLRWNDATNYASQAVSLTQSMKHEYFEAEALNLWGDILYSFGQLDQSKEKYKLSLEKCEQIGSPWVGSKNLVALMGIDLRNNGSAFEKDFHKLHDYLLHKEYFDQLSRLQLLYAEWLFEKNNPDAIPYYQQACATAVKYNWHWMDRTLRVILKGKNGHEQLARMLFTSLIDFWKASKFENVPLTSLESNASRIWGGSGTIKQSFIDRVSEALLLLDSSV